MADLTGDSPSVPRWDLEGEVFRNRLARLYDLTARGPADAAGLDAFVQAQEEVLAGLLTVEDRRATLRAERSSLSRAEYERAGRVLRRAEAAIRRGADAMAWHMVGGQLWILRRLHSGATRPALGSSAWSTVAAAARDYLTTHSGSFALMSDLTSFIDVGDLLVRGREALVIAEVKTGVVNEKILDALHGMGSLDDLVAGAEKPQALARQVERVRRQSQRLEGVTEVLSTGRGMEHGVPIRVFGEEVLQEESYVPQLASILAGTETRDWSIGEVDRCLYVGAYKGAAAFKSGAVFSAWVNTDASLEGPTVDLGAALFEPLACPLHVHPALAPYAIPVAMGDLRVLLRLSLSSLADLAEGMGLSVSPVSRAEGERLCLAAPSRRDVFRWKGKVYGMSNGRVTFALAGGLLGRIFHNQTTPTFALDLTRRMLEGAQKIAGSRE